MAVTDNPSPFEEVWQDQGDITLAISKKEPWPGLQENTLGETNLLSGCPPPLWHRQQLSRRRQSPYRIRVIVVVSSPPGRHSDPFQRGAFPACPMSTGRWRSFPGHRYWTGAGKDREVTGSDIKGTLLTTFGSMIGWKCGYIWPALAYFASMQSHRAELSRIETDKRHQINFITSLHRMSIFLVVAVGSTVFLMEKRGKVTRHKTVHLYSP